MEDKKKWYEHLESLDRRIIYLAVFVCLVIPYFFTVELPLPMDKGTKSLFDSIEKLYRENEKRVADGKPKKIALVIADWDASTKAECWPETVAVMAHLFQRKIPFAMLSFFPEGPQFAKYCVEDIQKLGKIKGIDGQDVDYSKITYGTDYCDWGYKLPDTPIYLGFASNLYSIVEQDGEGTPIREVPMMRDVKSMHDVRFVFHSAGSGMIQYWIAYVRPAIMFDLACGCTGIMGPEFSPFLQSGQLCGLMIGMSGAYMYEQAVKIKGLATMGMFGQSIAHIWVIIAMILGNIGYVLLKRKQARDEAAQL